MQPEISDIFKTSIYRNILNVNTNLLNDYCFNLQKIKKTRNRSNKGGWQSNNILSNEGIIANLNHALSAHLNIYSKKLEIKPLKIVDLWININNYKDYNTIHMHPRSIISGVFYIKVPVNSGNLILINPSSDFMDSCIDSENDLKNKNNKNSTQVVFEPKENLLVMFPSWINHMVDPNMNETEERISISFNSICI